jgi:fatty acid desaturase
MLAWTLVWFLSRYLGWITSTGLFWGGSLDSPPVYLFLVAYLSWLLGYQVFVFLVSFVGSLFGIFSFSREEIEGRERVRAECSRFLEIKMRDLKKKERELREREEGLRGMEREEKGGEAL